MADRKLRVAVALSGCGVYDGTEIHEAVALLLAIDRAGHQAVCFAPDIDQTQVINHLTGEEMSGPRNVLIESARIARGHIFDLAGFRPEDFDALVLPGGFGAAKNLSSFAFDGAKARIDPGVEAALVGMRDAGKPIGAVCIAPAILAKLFGGEGVELTIGDDAGTAQALESLGAKHTTTTHCQVVVDRRLKVVTAPCYMLDATISQIADGAAAVIAAVGELAG